MSLKYPCAGKPAAGEGRFREPPASSLLGPRKGFAPLERQNRIAAMEPTPNRLLPQGSQHLDGRERSGKPPAQRFAETGDHAEFAALSQSRLALPRFGHLYRSGDEFKFLYLVRCGFLKSTVVTDDGREQVTGFHMAGDVLGLDGIDSGRYCREVIALEDSEVSAIPYAALEAFHEGRPGLNRLIHRAMSREILREQAVLLMLGGMLADQRIAAFLLELSQRHLALGFSRSEFVLRTTRAEIGSYLGLTLETVSRCFSRMDKDGLIELSLRHVRIRDAAGLEALVAGARLAADPSMRRQATGKLDSSAPWPRPLEEGAWTGPVVAQ